MEYTFSGNLTVEDAYETKVHLYELMKKMILQF